MKCFPILPFIMLLALAACGVAPTTEFIPSKKSAVELRAMQTRSMPGDDNTVMRGVVATLHDLGYRITRAETDAGTVSGTRMTRLRMAVVVRAGTGGQSIVRANATVLAPGREAQVDDPEFYRNNFFGPLAATTGRQLADAPEGNSVPDAVRPVAELNTAVERKAAMKAAVAPPPPAKTDAKP